MPPKRKATDDGRPKQSHTPWTPAEEAAFDTHVDELVRAHLWQKAKDDPLLSGRGANGVRAHWIAKFKKMVGK